MLKPYAVLSSRYGVSPLATTPATRTNARAPGIRIGTWEGPSPPRATLTISHPANGTQATNGSTSRIAEVSTTCGRTAATTSRRLIARPTATILGRRAALASSAGHRGLGQEQASSITRAAVKS